MALDHPPLTPLGVMVLGLLREGDMHPYEMLRLLRTRHDDRLVRVQRGTLYHTVSRLERAGLLAEVGVDRDGRRPERTTYTLTDAGYGAVAGWVRHELPRTDHPVEFSVALAEAHNLEAGEVIELLERRRGLLAGELEGLRSALASASARGAAFGQYVVEIDRAAALLAADLAWLDDLLLRLRDGSLPWGAHPPTPKDSRS